MTEPEVEHRASKLGDRRKPAVGEIVGIVVLILQLCGIVWGAATLKSGVDNLSGAVDKLSIETGGNTSAISDLRGDVRVLQERLPARQAP